MAFAIAMGWNAGVEAQRTQGRFRLGGGIGVFAFDARTRSEPTGMLDDETTRVGYGIGASSFGIHLGGGIGPSLLTAATFTPRSMCPPPKPA